MRVSPAETGPHARQDLAMNMAVAPALAARTLVRMAREEPRGPAARKLLKAGVRIGDKDMPNAFRSILILPEHLSSNAVAAKDPVSREVRYWQMYAALFGYESAVYGFGRWSVFLEAARRRLCMLLWSMYVHDGAFVEPSQTATQAQTLINELFNLLVSR